MLYKKVHRQYLRQFRIGREFKYEFCGFPEVCKVTGKPYIGGNYIQIDYKWLIALYSGRFWYNITWLN